MRSPAELPIIRKITIWIATLVPPDTSTILLMVLFLPAKHRTSLSLGRSVEEILECGRSESEKDQAIVADVVRII